MIVGIDLGGTSISLGQLHNNELIRKISVPSPADKCLEESLSSFMDAISPLINDNIKGIGIGVPSVVDTEMGIVYNVANIPSWEEVHLKSILEEKFNIPVFLNNDANCFALGEKKFGKGKQYKNMVGITLGTGVGAALIINNELYEGSNTGAGEIGEIKYLDGIYEEYCAAGFFLKRNTTGKIAAEKASGGDEEALGMWDEFGRHLGELMRTVLLAYDPEAVIFGGSISYAFPYFNDSLNRSLQSFPYPKSLEKLKIEVSENPDIALLGAAALVTDG